MEQKSARTVFLAALSTTCLLYIAIGCSCVYFFGSTVKQSINQNWVGFTWNTAYVVQPPQQPPQTAQTPPSSSGGASGGTNNGDLQVAKVVSKVVTAGWARVLSFCVVLIPALNTLSVYPLVVITLGNSIAVSLPKPKTEKGGAIRRRYVTFLSKRVVAYVKF